MIKKCLTKEKKGYTEHLTCSKETKNMIMINCKEEFLKHHPEISDIKISSGFMLKKIAEFYMRDV